MGFNYPAIVLGCVTAGNTLREGRCYETLRELLLNNMVYWKIMLHDAEFLGIMHTVGLTVTCT